MHLTTHAQEGENIPGSITEVKQIRDNKSLLLEH